jgi:ATP-dependent DNA helicase 2 subunit 1
MLDPEAPAPIISANKPIEEGGISLLQSLLSSINSRAVPKRTLFSNLPLELSPNLKISVKGYILFKRQEPARSCYIWLNGEIPQIAEGKSAYVAEDTARTVEKVELRKAFKFGGETITFTPEELSKIRTFGDPVIRLIGFKPLTMLPIWANLRPSTFIYPSEDDVIGSTRTFSALHQSMLKKNVFGLVWYIPRKNAVPNLAALIPGAEKLDDNNEQIMPPGLWIVVLPYADDIRAKPALTKTPHLPEELIDKMHQIIQQLQLPKAEYDPSKYPNPSLQWHYRILQALALEEDVPTRPEDKTIPKVIRGLISRNLTG